MEYKDVVALVEDSVKECTCVIKNNPHAIFTEADFERILTNTIEKNLQAKAADWVVHNQISHYYKSKLEENSFCSPNEKIDYRVDIVVLNKEFTAYSYKHHKGIIYSYKSIALELKYFRCNDNVERITKDFEKAESLTMSGIEKDSTLFVIPLFEKTDDVNRLQDKIPEKYEKDINKNVKLMVLSKESDKCIICQ